MSGTLLRLPNGTQLSPEFSRNLEALTGPGDTEFYETTPDLSAIYKRRRDSLYSAFLFILKAWPPQTSLFSNPADILEKFATSCQASCIFKKQDNIDTLQNTLKTFKTELVHALAEYWNYPQDKALAHATECLNEAEQYVLLQKERNDIATLFPKTIHGQPCYILQFEQVLPPGQASWYNELRDIQAMKAPKSPEWFYKLSPCEQEYIANFRGSSLKAEIKGLIDFSVVLQNSRGAKLPDDLAAIAAKTGNLPDWFVKLPLHQQTIFAANLPNSMEKIEAILLKFRESCSDDIQQLNALPLWYTTLSEIQQHFLGYVLQEAGDKPMEKVFTWLSSRHRTLPALANARKHQFMILNDKGEILFGAPVRYGSSHIVSRDVRNMGDAIIKVHMNNNLQQICNLITNEGPLIVQTLISPHWLLKYLKLIPDLYLFTLLKMIVNEFNHKTNEIFQTNHPLNYIKYFNYTSASGVSDCNSLLTLAKKAEIPSASLQALIAAYEQVLHSNIGSATVFDYRGRELFISSLEHLLILQLEGLSYGSCVSGKDRKAVEFIHTDAMLLYFYIYKKYHVFYDSAEERKNFVDIVTDLYVTRHQQEHAGQNAPGSEAIKTPDMYWPADIAKAITSRLKDDYALKNEDRIASNNEVNKIGVDKSIDPRMTSCKIIAIALGEAKCQKIYDTLCPIMEERDRFKKSTWVPASLYSSPQESFGIQEIRKLMDEKKQIHSTKTASEIVAKILNIIVSRPDSNEGRTEYTITVYKFGHSIYKAPQKVDDILQGMAEFYSKTLYKNREKSCLMH